jgi:hypothetical protein
MLANDGQPLKLTWDVVVEQFNRLIKFAAKQQVQNNTTDTMVSAEDLYQEGMIKLYDCWKIWCVDKNKDMDEFGPIFRKSLFRQVRAKGKSTRFAFIDLEDAVMLLEDENGEDVVQNMYIENGIKHLKSMLHSESAKMIIDELVSPSPRTIYEAWADKARKEMLKSQGKRVNVPKDNTIRMKHIKKSLDITKKQYDNAMEEIKRIAPLAFSK